MLNINKAKFNSLIRYEIYFYFTFLCLTACGHYQWKHDHKPLSSLEQDNAECRLTALQSLPPNIIQSVEPDYFARSYNQLQLNNVSARRLASTTSCHNHRFSLDCETYEYDAPKPQLLPETRIVNIDTNLNARNEATGLCLQNKGWKLEYIEY